MLVSCGVLLLDPSARVFACRATGTSRWDLPKGVVDAGETAREAAVREAWEEAGLRLPAEADALADLGEHAYLAGKRLHLFGARVGPDPLDLRACRCRSFFTHARSGRLVPEVDDWRWQPLDTPGGWAGKNLARVLGQLDRRRLAAMPFLASIEVDDSSLKDPLP